MKTIKINDLSKLGAALRVREALTYGVDWHEGRPRRNTELMAWAEVTRERSQVLDTFNDEPKPVGFLDFAKAHGLIEGRRRFSEREGHTQDPAILARIAREIKDNTAAHKVWPSVERLQRPPQIFTVNPKGSAALDKLMQDIKNKTP